MQAKKAEKKAKKRKHKETNNRQPAAGNGRQHTASPVSPDDSSDQDYARPAKQHKSDRNAAVRPSHSNRDVKHMASKATRGHETLPRSNRDAAQHATDDRQQHHKSDELARHDSRAAHGDQGAIKGSCNDRYGDPHSIDRDRIDSSRRDSHRYREGNSERRSDTHSNDRRDNYHDRYRPRHDSRSLSPPRRQR